MKKLILIGMAAASTGLLTGCTESLLDPGNDRAEQYVQSFIERYGVPAEGHTFSMAQQCGITVRTSSPTDVKVTANEAGTEYLFADWKGVNGTQLINFDLPVGISKVKVHANGNVFSAKVGDVVNIDAPQKAKSRGDKNLVLQNNKGMITWLDSKLDPEAKIVIDGTEQFYGALLPTEEAEKSIGLNYYNNKDADGRYVGYHHTRKYHVGSLFKMLLCTDKNNTNFYTESNRFFNDNFYVNYTRPGIELSYVRKDLNLEIGMLVANDVSFDAATAVYAIPMFETKSKKNLLVKKVPAATQIDPTTGEMYFNQRGASIKLAFTGKPFTNVKGEEGNVLIEKTNVQDENCFTWDFNTTTVDENKSHSYMYGLKNEVLKLYELYKPDASGKRILPLPGDNGRNEIVFPGGTVPPFITVVEVDGEEKEEVTPGEVYFPEFQKYLEYCLGNLTEDQRKSYTELKGLKEWLVSRGFVFEENDIPEVSPVLDPQTNEIIPDAYNISFRMAKYTQAYASLDECSNPAEYIESKDIDDYTVYLGLFGDQNIPPQLSGNAVAWYFKDLDNPSHFVTTLDGDIKMRSPQLPLSLEGKPSFSEGGSVEHVLDFDGDGLYNDVIFAVNAWGGSSNDGFPSYTWLLACEDLGSTGDNDYNDLVVSMQYTSSNSVDKVNIYPQAAGGVYAAYLMYNEVLTSPEGEITDKQTYFVGPEIHKWLGNFNTDEMVGTDEKTLYNFTNDYGVSFEYQKFRHGNNSFSTVMNNLIKTQGVGVDGKFTGDFAGFWVLVDKDGKVAESGLGTDKYEIKPVEIESDEFKAISGSLYQVANAQLGNVAVPMIMVLGPQWEWPKETIDIKEAYPSWKDWIGSSDRNSVHWYGKSDNKEDGCNISGSHFPPDIKRENVTVRKEVEDLYNRLNNNN